jgi:hypothetical protein
MGIEVGDTFKVNIACGAGIECSIVCKRNGDLLSEDIILFGDEKNYPI